MARTTLHNSVWRLARTQHGVIARGQLMALGYTREAIAHRVERGRLHPVRRGIYAIGRPQLTRNGERMAAVLACGPTAVLSNHSAAALWGIRPDRGGRFEVAVDRARCVRPRGILVHRRTLRAEDVTRHQRIPVTGVACTIVDLAPELGRTALERAIDEADKLELIDPERLRDAVEAMRGRRGAPLVRRVLDRQTFVLTDSELERLLLPIARRAGLNDLVTGAVVNGFRVDFYSPGLDLVIETDGLRYHRTPGQQTRDRLRDQAHVAAGRTAVRFTHAQIAYAPRATEATLARVVARLRAQSAV